jgi:ElaB/YqjD/DUF883 family membrane-anchored ribosome-binding protein
MTINRLLIAASASSAEVAEVPSDIRQLIDDAEEILVMSPELPSRLEWLASDTDKTREKADQRMRDVMDVVDDADTQVKGTVGADDPLLAFDEAVAEFEPSHILVIMRPNDRAGWQESGLIDSLNERFEIPVTSHQVP